MKYSWYTILCRFQVYSTVIHSCVIYIYIYIYGEGNGNPLLVWNSQDSYSCLENPMHRGTWIPTVHGIPKSWIQLTHTHTHTHIFFPYRLLQNIKYSSLFYTLGPCLLSILYIIEQFAYFKIRVLFSKH